jgi:UDP-glucose 4-epimerase
MPSYWFVRYTNEFNKKNNMKKILITGAHGLLSKHFISKYKKQYQITGTIHRNNDTEIPDIELLNIDFATDWKATDLPSNIDTVIHLAQSSNYRDFPNSAEDIFKVNVDSTAKLLEFARKAGAKTFIYASTGGLYGSGKLAFKENSNILPLDELNFHFSSKLSGEVIAQPYSSLMNVIIVRPFFIYGFGQRRSMLIPRLFDSIKAGEEIKIQGQNGIKINPIHVNDAVLALHKAIFLEESNKFNFAGKNIFTIRQICEGIGEYLGIVPKFHHEEVCSEDLIADISLMMNDLHIPTYNLLEHISDVAV